MSVAGDSEPPTSIRSAPVGRSGVIAGKYAIDRVLGEGAVGIVVAAHHIHLKQRVAVKFLHPKVAAEPLAVARFLREAQSASQLKSEHVARVTDFGTQETGEPFLVMELLEGRDLGALLADRGPLPVAEAVDHVLQALEGVAEAHAHGIVHRDLKPENLFLTTRADGSPLVKVLDFGLSKNVTEAANVQSLTHTSDGAVGSPMYMAPEQVRSTANVSFAGDQWSMAVVLYELLTCECPFSGESMTSLLAAILMDAPRPLRDLRPDVHPALEAAVMRCFFKDPRGRHPDVGAFARELGPFASASCRSSVERIVGSLGGRPTSGPRVDAGTPALADLVDSPPDVTGPQWTSTHSAAAEAPRSSGRAKLVLLASVAVVTATGIIVVALASTGLMGSRTEAAARSEEPAAAVAPAPSPSPATLSSPASAESVRAHDAAPGPSASAPAASSSSPAPSRPQPRPRPRPRPSTTPKDPSPHAEPSIDDVIKKQDRR